MLAQEMRAFVHERCAVAVERFFPDLRVPRTFAAYRVSTDFAVDLAYTLKYLHRAGITHIGQRTIVEAIHQILTQVDGEKTETFYSYRIAETLAAFGELTDANALWSKFSDEQRANLVNAVDSSHIYNAETDSLGGKPNNYWGVLARCEFARQKLGLLADDKLLKYALTRVEKILFANPRGFFDDSKELGGRYDLYTADVHLFLEPLWHLLDRAKLRHNLKVHTQLLETIALENGAFIAWGRSIGALSVCATFEMAAVALREKLTADDGRLLGLAANAFAHFKTWFSDDLINAHRGRMTYNYRGPFRLLQMTFDCLGKVAYAAQVLDTVERDIVPAEKGAMFTARDEFVHLDESTAVVWMFRNNHFAFQLPVVDNTPADYVPWLHAPGMFENPVDSPLLMGVPRLFYGDSEYAPAGLPKTSAHGAGTLALHYDRFTRTAGKAEAKHLPGARHITYRIDADTIEVREQWTFEQTPDAVMLCVPEADWPLEVHFESPQQHTASVVAVSGMQLMRSYWGEIKRLHQVDFAVTPGLREITLRYTIRPQIKIAQGPFDHDYNRALYGGLGRDRVVERPFFNGTCARQSIAIERLFGDAEIIHIGWPEHLFGAHGLSEEDFDKRWDEFLALLKASGKKVMWTMHNRRPHGWPKERGVALYRKFAPVVDACLHHSRWGEALMRGEYEFRPECRHYVLPHMHFGEQMQMAATRAELEKQYGLPACGMRFGVLGRYQKEKQIEMIIEAFSAAARADQQLVVTAWLEKLEKPKDPRVIVLPRKDWLTREDIAGHNKLCDGLVLAHTGDTYLTTGLVADTVGMGTAMLAPKWPFLFEILGEGAEAAAVYHDNTPESLTALFKEITMAQVEHAKERARALQPRYSPAACAAILYQAAHDLRTSR